MSRYAGYEVLSDIPLPALGHGIRDGRSDKTLRINRQSPPSVPAVEELDWRHVWHDSDGSSSLQLAAIGVTEARHAVDYLLRVPEQGDFHITPASSTILVDSPLELAANTLEHLLLDQIIPRLLAGSGNLVVHASLVRLRHGTIAFIGRSGWGKSTLAALLHHRGHPALCDDCTLLSRHGETVFATPSYPGLRLYADSIDHALRSDSAFTPVSNYSDKQRIIGLELPSELLDAQPLSAICLLDDPEFSDGCASLDPISPMAACMAIIEHGFRLDPTETSQTLSQLQLASGVANAVPAFLLRYPRNFAQQEALVDLLLDRLGTLDNMPR